MIKNAKGKAYILRQCLSDMTSCGGFRWPESGEVSKAVADRIEELEAENASFRALLTAASYGDIDGIAKQPPDVSAFLGQTVANLTISLRARAEAAEAALATARADALREVVAWHIREAENAMAALHCGSENHEYRAAGRLNDMHRDAAATITALNPQQEKPHE
jgi:hypothetical protein